MATVFKRTCDKKDKAAKWMIRWYDAENSKHRTVAGYTDKEMSLAKGRRLEVESQRRREGFTSGVREEALKPFDVHLDAYTKHILTSGGDGDYVKQLAQRIRRLFKHCKFLRLVDITDTGVESALLEMRTIRGFEKEEGKLLAVATRNEYITSITGFTAWAAAGRKMEFDPLAGLKKADLNEVDLVHPRRALGMEDVAALLDASLRRPVVELPNSPGGLEQGQNDGDRLRADA